MTAAVLCTSLSINDVYAENPVVIEESEQVANEEPTTEEPTTEEPTTEEPTTEEPTTKSDFEYEILADDTVKIKKYNKEQKGDLIIPEQIADKKVTVIAKNAFFNNGFDGKLVLPEGLKRIEDDAFYSCKKLTGELKLPESLEYIGEEAFQFCNFEGKLILPKGLDLSQIDKKAFFSEIIFVKGATELKPGESENYIVTANKLDITSSLIKEWKTSNKNVARVDSKGLVTAVSEGKVDISAIAYNGIEGKITIEVNDGKIDVSSVSLDRKDLILKKGYSYTLKTDVVPQTVTNKKIKWESSNPDIVKVDQNGKVTAQGNGVAYIKAMATDGSGKYAKCKVVVPYNVIYKLNNGKNSSKNPGIYYYKSFTLNNPSRSGYIFKGWYKDSHYKQKITKISASSKRDYTLYAKWEQIRVTSIKLSRTGMRIRKGSTYLFGTAVSPSTALVKKLEWKSSNPNVVTVDSKGKIRAVDYGVAYIYAKAIDGSGKYARCKIIVGYGISYHLNYGANNGYNRTIYYKENITFRSPYRTGYQFLGWYTDSRYKHRITGISSRTGKNLVLYARWHKIKVGTPSIYTIKSLSGRRVSLSYGGAAEAKTYQIIYSRDKKFRNGNRVIMSRARKITLTNLIKGKTYYVKVRAYGIDSREKRVYGKYSTTRAVRIIR